MFRPSADRGEHNRWDGEGVLFIGLFIICFSFFFLRFWCFVFCFDHFLMLLVSLGLFFLLAAVILLVFF